MTALRALPQLREVAPAATVAAYERWLAASASDDEYLYTDARVRFEVRPGDHVVGAPGLVATPRGGGTLLETPALEYGIELDVPADAVRRFLDLLDGERTFERARRDAKLEEAHVQKLVEHAFGFVLFAPLAVAQLDHSVFASEIVRFPGSPYEIPRNYWANMGSVRRRTASLFECVHDPLLALDELRSLHVVTLLGEQGTSFYRPASPIARKGISPGALWISPTRTVETPHGTLLLEGPRVNAKFLGGAVYASLQCELAGDPGATAARREHRDENGLDWGRVVWGRAEGDSGDAVWFCPPRPIGIEHVESLFGSLSSALSTVHGVGSDALCAHAADFHQKFVRLHPFRAANQSLAMAIVNELFRLRESRAPATTRRTGLPHLTLDHLALRLDRAEYRRVFALAVSEWTTVHRAGADRLRFYADTKRRTFALIERIGAALDLAEARALAEQAPRDARGALLLLDPNDSGRS